MKETASSKKRKMLRPRHLEELGQRIKVNEEEEKEEDEDQPYTYNSTQSLSLSQIKEIVNFIDRTQNINADAFK